MIKSLEVNDKKLIEKMRFLDTVGLQSWSDYEAYARCLFVLEGAEQAAPHFLEAAAHIENLIMLEDERDNKVESARLKVIQANYYRLAGEFERNQQLYGELCNIHMSLFENEFDRNKERGSSILSRLSYCLFFLEKYEESIHYGKWVKEWFPISVGYSEGILNNDSKRIEQTLQHVIMNIKKEKILLYYTGAEVSLWDWYNFGMSLFEKQVGR